MLLSKNNTDLVIIPIEKMIEKINAITNDPLQAVHDEEQMLLEIEMKAEAKRRRDLMMNGSAKKSSQKQIKKQMMKDQIKENQGPMETVVLEKTLGKISFLLALGFGEAGSKIIA